MTTYYVGSGGNDANSGLTWVLRKLTLNGVEDTPVIAGDVCYIAPGVYRELLTCDVSGGAGTPITYIGDVTGEHTDGVGGVVRITGSDDDQMATRANCISAVTRNYRTFRSFYFDTCTGILVDLSTNCQNCIIEFCSFPPAIAYGVNIDGLTQSTHTIRNCVFMGGSSRSIEITHSAVVNGSAHLIQNCIFLGGTSRGIGIDRVGGITIKNCLFLWGSNPLRVGTALTVGQTVVVNNCLFSGCSVAMQATVSGEIVENYNNLYRNAIDRTNVAVGANSTAYTLLPELPILLSGFRYPWQIGALSNWSSLRAITGTGEATDDLFGIARPGTAAKNSWGAIQYQNMNRDTATKRTGAASLKFSDAGRHQMFVPTTNDSTTISVYCYREVSYAGTNPQMVIRQPGVAARTTTDAGAAEGWNQLTDTFTPAAAPPYVIVELVSSNTAAGANIAAYFDDLVVT